MNLIGEIIPLLIVVLVAVCGCYKKVSIFSAFTVGAKKGLEAAVGILPTLVGIITAITMLSASGALDALSGALKPLCDTVGLPGDIIPLALLRPISGSGANSAVIDLFERHGPDSEIGKIASVLSSSTETTLYAITVYFAGRNYNRLKYTVPVAVIGDFTALVLSVFSVHLFG